ncbi:MAG: ISAs1 family transposase [Sphingobacteriales bacterium]|nr:MAG: ISAs1 family transposase [Sphingobacteriales bacterium]
MVFCSLLCGCSSFEEISDFGQLKLDWLRKHLPYKKGIPSHDTINRLLSILNTKQLEKVLSGICQYSIHLTNGSIVNIDGKRLSGSATIKEQQTKNTEGGRHAVVMVNVYCDAVKACLASIEVSGKAGEKNAITEILEVLDLSNCILTLDAGYCYTDVAKEIIEAQADYVMGVKRINQNCLQQQSNFFHKTVIPKLMQGKKKTVMVVWSSEPAKWSIYQKLTNP